MFAYICRSKNRGMKKLSVLYEDAVVFRWAILALSVIIYGITAYVSIGYYHADEHYQIVEFAGIKLGYNQPSDLAWEYNAQIRPTIQIWVFYFIASALKFFSITDSYTQLFIVRLISGLVAIAAISYCIKPLLKTLNEKLQMVLIALSFLLFFQPYLNVRFSSEAWSGICVVFSMGVVLRRKMLVNWHYLLGALLGFGFLFRFQTAFFALGVGLWLLFVGKEKFIDLVKLVTVFVLVWFIGIGIDSCFYQKFTITAYSYYRVNIVEGVASNFGVSPWYFYTKYLNELPIFGKILISSYIFLMFLKPKNVFLWATLPFILIHIVTPHKESRFLFPLANFSGIVIVYGVLGAYTASRSFFGKLANRIKSLAIFTTRKCKKRALVFVTVFLVAANSIGLVYTCSWRNNGGTFNAIKEILEMPDVKQVSFFSPGGMLVLNLSANFYTHGFNIPVVSKFKLAEFLLEHPGKRILYIRKCDQSDDVKELIARLRMKKIYSSIPGWILLLDDVFDQYGWDRFLAVDLYLYDKRDNNELNGYIQNIKERRQEMMSFVQVYSNSNFNEGHPGYCVRLNEGKYDSKMLIKMGVKSHDISSLRIPPDFKVILYSKDSLRGKSIVCDANEEKLEGLSFNDSTVSLEIIRDTTWAGRVNVYRECGHRDLFLKLKPGKYGMKLLENLGMENDDISSIKVSDSLQVTLYQNDEFQGDSLVVDKSVDCLSTLNWDDNASSIIVSRKKK